MKNKRVEPLEMAMGVCLCPRCKSLLIPKGDGEVMDCPHRCVLGIFPEDAAHVYMVRVEGAKGEAK